MTTIDLLSYAANLIFVTWGIADFIFRLKEKRSEANSLVGIQEMANRLASQLKGSESEQAKDVACTVKSLIFSARGKSRDDGELLKIKNQDLPSRAGLKLLNINKLKSLRKEADV